MAEQLLVYQTEIFWESWNGDVDSFDPGTCFQNVQDGINDWIQEHPAYQILTTIPSQSSSTYTDKYGSVFVAFTYSVAVNYLTSDPEPIDFGEDEEER